MNYDKLDKLKAIYPNGYFVTAFITDDDLEIVETKALASKEQQPGVEVIEPEVISE